MELLPVAAVVFNNDSASELLLYVKAQQASESVGVLDVHVQV